MAKTIKVEEHVYDDLEKLRGKRETFSQIVEHLLVTYRRVRGLADLVGPRAPREEVTE